LIRCFRHIVVQELLQKCALVNLDKQLNHYGDILFQLQQQLGARDFPTFVETRARHAEKTTIEINDARNFFSNVQNRAGEDKDGVVNRRHELTQAFLEDLERIPRAVLFIDAVEQAEEGIRNWLHNELLLGLCQHDGVTVVLAGRELQPPPVTWDLHCYTHPLASVRLEDCLEFNEKYELGIEEIRWDTLHQVFKGKPGLIFESAKALTTRLEGLG
jgi:hypothetical protein